MSDLSNLLAAESAADKDHPEYLLEAQLAVIFAEFAARAGCCDQCMEAVEGYLSPHLPAGYQRLRLHTRAEE